jgi:hypothetical protein
VKKKDNTGETKGDKVEERQCEEESKVREDRNRGKSNAGRESKVEEEARREERQYREEDRVKRTKKEEETDQREKDKMEKRQNNFNIIYIFNFFLYFLYI